MNSLVKYESVSHFYGDQLTGAERYKDNLPLWLEKKVLARKKLRIANRYIEYSDRFGACRSLRFATNGRTFVAGYRNGAIEVYSYDGEVLNTIRDAAEDLQPVMCVQYHPQDPDVFFASDIAGFVYICKPDTQNELDIFAREPKNEINSFDINRSGKMMVTGGKDAILRMYDLASARLTGAYSKPKHNEEAKALFHESRIFKVKFHPEENNILLTGGWDNCVKVWDTRQNAGCIKNIPGPQVYGDAIDVRDRTILTGSWKESESLQIWDLRQGKLIDTVVTINRPYSIDGEFVYCAHFFYNDDNDDTIISGTSGAGMLEIISMSEKKVVAGFKVSKVIYAADSFDDYIVFGGMEDSVKIAQYDMHN